MQPAMKIAVIGAGINGLSSAWGLERDGHEVSVFEQGPIPNPLGSSYDQNRLIRFPYGANLGYTRLVAAAYDAWDRLWSDLGETFYVRTGTLAIARGETSWTDQSAQTLAQAGVETRRLSPSDIERIFPMLRTEGIRYALYLESGGELFPTRIIEALTRHLRARGVRIFENTPVKSIDVERARAVLHDESVVDADALVVAAGPWVARLLPDMSRRVTPSRQVLAYAEPPPQYAEHWKHGPMLMDLDGAGFYLVPPAGGTDLKVGDHRFSLTGQPDADREPSPEETQAVFEQARRALRDFDQYKIKATRTCFYTVESGERHLVEQRGRSWLVSACSGHGFKFGALTGLAVADGVAGRRSADEIARTSAGENPGVMNPGRQPEIA
jgi:glycine/D-amino acid oxidase-like deaminating enzyme